MRRTSRWCYTKFARWLSPGKCEGTRLAQGRPTCRWCSWAGFVTFKNKTVNYHLQVASGQAGHVTQKFVDGLILVSGQNLFVKVNFIKAESRFSKWCGIYLSCDKLLRNTGLFSTAMKHNGPAIWGGCVTRRKHRQSPGTLAWILSRWKEGMAHFLPPDSYREWYKFYWVLARSRYKFDRSRKFIPSYKVVSVPWRSVAAQVVSGP